jgi:hypothetical protein
MTCTLMKTAAIVLMINLVLPAFALEGKPPQAALNEVIDLFPQKTTVESFVNACRDFSKLPSLTNEEAVEWLLSRSNQIAKYLEANPKPTEKPVMSIAKEAPSVSGGPHQHLNPTSRENYDNEVRKNRQLAQKHHEYDVLALLLDEYIQKLQIVVGSESLKAPVVKAHSQQKLHPLVAARLGLTLGK